MIGLCSWLHTGLAIAMVKMIASPQTRMSIPLRAVTMHFKHAETTLMALVIIVRQNTQLQHGKAHFVANKASSNHGKCLMAKTQCKLFMSRLLAVLITYLRCYPVTAASFGLTRVLTQREEACSKKLLTTTVSFMHATHVER
jgi:hypothetical protein